MRQFRSSLKTLNSNAYEKLREEIEKITAIEAAELFLSPHVREDIFLETLREPGPTLWIVNRSDVSDRVLAKLLRHPLPQISTRAAEKLKARYSTISHLAPPLIEESYETVEDYLVEDILGHPLCPWDAMIFFSRSANEDVRASAALSLTRRLLEQPHQSSDLPFMKDLLMQVFSNLAKNDLSPMVRGYIARAPIWDGAQVTQFAKNEHNPVVKAKWLQNDGAPNELLEGEAFGNEIDLYLRKVIALDMRLSPAARKKLQNTSPDPFELAVHEAYLADRK